jgi:hypothetical protein
MTDDPRLPLLHAEIDGELDEGQRAELARWLLADPVARSLREELRRVCARLDGLEAVDPPHDLMPAVLDRLPKSPRTAVQHWWSAPRWRYAAAIAAVLSGTLMLYEVGYTPMRASDAAGTIAAGSRLVNTVPVNTGSLTGWLSLYRDPAGLSLKYHVVAAERVDMVVSSGGKTLRIINVGTADGHADSGQLVPLSGFDPRTPAIAVTLIAGGRVVSSTTLTVPDER